MNDQAQTNAFKQAPSNNLTTSQVRQKQAQASMQMQNIGMNSHWGMIKNEMPVSNIGPKENT